MKQSINTNSQHIKFPTLDYQIPLLKQNNIHKSSGYLRNFSIKRVNDSLKDSNERLLTKLLSKKQIKSIERSMTQKKQQPTKIQSSYNLSYSTTARISKSRNIISLCKSQLQQFDKLREHYLSTNSIQIQQLKRQKSVNKVQYSVQRIDQLHIKKKIFPNKNLVKYYRNKKQTAPYSSQLSSANSAIKTLLKKQEELRNVSSSKLRKYAEMSREQFLNDNPQQPVKKTKRYRHGKKQTMQNYQNKLQQGCSNVQLNGWTNNIQVFIYDHQNQQF